MGDEDDRRVQFHQRLLKPFERFDVEVVGRLVEQQHIGRASQRSGQRAARHLAAGEAVERASEVALVEAEAEDDVGHAVAPVVAAGQLEAGLHVCVGIDCALVALSHLRLQVSQLCFQRNRLSAAAEYVIAQRQ
ncbi:unannotated protein [freshwater metagenome]|uniref:Unannotated protein n=1 Tax=freshwater metagenome TaxID=449393 RepID=A0A6J5ZVF4_9ZZZZ